MDDSLQHQLFQLLMRRRLQSVPCQLESATEFLDPPIHEIDVVRATVYCLIGKD